MNLTRDIELHKKVYRENHTKRVENQLAEECAELISVLLRKQRPDRVVSIYDLQSEVADVEICLAFLKSGFESKPYEKVLALKMSKMKAKLTELLNG